MAVNLSKVQFQGGGAVITARPPVAVSAPKAVGVRAVISGVSSLMKKLLGLKTQAQRDANLSYQVGYTQSYAVWVHERMDVFHPVGQAKFLEQPARELGSNGTLARIVSQTMRSGGTLRQALLSAGLHLQRASQMLCPVDTGALRNSAFTRIEEGMPPSLTPRLPNFGRSK